MKDNSMPKQFWAVYKKRAYALGLIPYLASIGYERIEADDVAKAQTIANEHAKVHNWRVGWIRELLPEKAFVHTQKPFQFHQGEVKEE